MTDPGRAGVRQSARQAARMPGQGEALIDMWRHVVIQLLDDYESVRRHQGAGAAAAHWRPGPEGRLPGRSGVRRAG